MDILAKLLGSPIRVKLMRLFLFNDESIFDLKTVSARIRGQKSSVRKELNALCSMSFIKKRVVKGKTIGYSLNPDFEFLKPVKALLIDPEFISRDELISRLRPAGKIKLLIVAGVFIQNPESRLDILIVSDKLKRPTLDEAMRKLESEIGKELAYAVFSAEEFSYRLDMYDKLVADVLDFPHEKLLTTPEFSTFNLKKS